MKRSYSILVILSIFFFCLFSNLLAQFEISDNPVGTPISIRYSPEPPGSDELFVNGSGYHYDQYLARGDVPGARAQYGVFINRFYSPLMNFDANGFLTNAEELINKKLLPEKATLTLRIFDVDDDGCDPTPQNCDHNGDGIPDPEIDYVYVNGHRIENAAGQPRYLTTGNNVWSIWPVDIPIEWLKFPQAPGSPTAKPMAENIIEIEINVLNITVANGYTADWRVTCDWISIKIPSPRRPILFAHGWRSSPDTWNVFKSRLDNPSDAYGGIPYHIPAADVIDPNGAIRSNGYSLWREVDKIKNIFGVDKINIIAHSKGGLDSRQLTRLTNGKDIEHLIQLGTPNHGSKVADGVWPIGVITGEGMPALEQLTTWWIRDNFNYITSGIFNTIVGRRWIKYSSINYKIAAGWLPSIPLFGLEVPNDGVVSARSASLPWYHPNPYPNNGVIPIVDKSFPLLYHLNLNTSSSAFEWAINQIGDNIGSISPFPYLASENIDKQYFSDSFGGADTLQELHSENGFVNFGDTATVAVSVDLVNKLVFTVFTIDGKVDMFLEDTLGQRIDSIVAQTNPDITFNHINTELYDAIEYVVLSPITGLWNAKVIGNTAANFALSIEVEGDIEITNMVGDKYVNFGEPLLISGKLTENSVPVVGATAYAEILKADASTDSLELYDDGTHGDSLANDGIYSNIFSETDALGVGRVKIVAINSLGVKRASSAFMTITPYSARLNNLFNESTADPNGNGLFDELDINVGVDVLQAGDFELTAVLRDLADSVITTATYSTIIHNQSPLPIGNHSLQLQFDGRDISRHGEDGPYKLTNVTLVDLADNSIQVDYQQNPYTTASYSASNFERPIFSLTGNITETPLDTTGNGKYDILSISLELDVAVSGFYNFNAQMTDTTGNNIVWAINSKNMNVGLNTVVLEFDGLKINEAGLNGPYNITNLSLYNDVTGDVESFLNIHITAPYSYTDFTGNEIYGTVVDPISLTPLEKALVVLGGDRINADSIDTDGSFRFGGLPDGFYTLYASHGNFRSDTLMVSIPPSANLTLLLALPTIEISTTALNEQLMAGDTATQTVTIINSGSAPLHISILEEPPLLTLQYSKFSNTTGTQRLKIQPHIPIAKRGDSTFKNSTLKTEKKIKASQSAILLPIASPTGSSSNQGDWFSLETFDDSLFYDGFPGSFSDFVGFGSAVPLFAAMRFTPLSEFQLSHVHAYYRTEISSAPVEISIHQHNSIFNEPGNLIFSQSLGSEFLNPNGRFFLVDLTERHTFMAGEDFWIVLHYQDVPYPQLTTDNGINQVGRSKFSADGISWSSLGDVLGDGFEDAWVIRALAAADIPWIDVSPSSATIAPGASEDINVNFDATGLASGVYNANLRIRSDDPDNPTSIIPVTLNVVTIRTFNVEVAENWNMLSLPAEVEDPFYLSLFPNAIQGTMFGYDNGYFNTDTLEICTGYWLRFPASETVPVIGAEHLSCEISLNEGWNLIGSLSCDVPLAGIDDPGDIIIPGTLFGFDLAYFAADTLKQGYGYWIRTNAAGAISLSCVPLLAKAGTKQTDNLPDLSRYQAITISDAGGGSQTLYLGVRLEDPASLMNYAMPPLPPAGSFDARFSGGYRVTEAEEALINIQATRYPLRVRVSGGEQGVSAQYVVQEITGDQVVGEHSARAGEEILITNPQVNALKVSKTAALPTKFEVSQNYPNPFNPVTEIKYAIPYRDKVSIVVYNTLGQKVKTLVSKPHEPGYYTVTWDGTNNSGHQVGSGVYFYVVKAGEHRAVKKMVLLR